MATRIYLPSSGTPDVTPTDWEFATQVNPLSFKAVTSRISSAMTTKTEATGTVSPVLKGMLRYVIGPLAAQTITGTLKGQIRGSESNAGANASPAISIKIIQPSGADRAILLAPTAADSAVSPHEFLTALTNIKFENASEIAAIPLTSGAATAGDYLVIEVGFRSATTTTRNVSLSYGDNSATDLAEDFTTTTANNPWVEFSQTLNFIINIGSPADSLYAHSLTSPTITQVHVVTPAASAYASAFASPTVAQVPLVTPADLLHALSFGVPTITQIPLITPSGLSHALVFGVPVVDVPPPASQGYRSMGAFWLGNAGIGDAFVFPPATTYGLTFESPQLVGPPYAFRSAGAIWMGGAGVPNQIIIFPDQSLYGVSFESPTVLPIFLVNPNNLAHADSLGSPAVTQVHGVSPASSSYGTTLGSPAVTQVHAVVPGNLLHADSLPSPAITQTQVVSPNNLTHANSLTSPATTQVHGVSPASSSFSGTLGSPTVSPSGVIVPDSMAFAHSLTGPVVGQVHEVVPSSLVHSDVFGSPLVDSGAGGYGTPYYRMLLVGGQF